MPSTRKMWIIFSSLLALVLAAVAWMLVMSPVRDASTKLKSDAQSVEGSNEILSAKVAKLRTQFAQIDDLRKELGEFQTQIPATVSYTGITDEIDRAVEKSEVALLSVSAEEAISPVTPFTAIKVEPKNVDPNAPEGTSESAEAAAPADSEPKTVSGAPPTKTGALSTNVDGFFQLPLTITVQGSYDDILTFTQELQQGSERAILAYSISAVALEEQPESDTAPASEEGDLTYTIDAIAYVLSYDTSVVPTEGDEDEAPKMPKPATDNVFSPGRKG